MADQAKNKSALLCKPLREQQVIITIAGIDKTISLGELARARFSDYCSVLLAAMSYDETITQKEIGQASSRMRGYADAMHEMQLIEEAEVQKVLDDKLQNILGGGN